MNNEFQSPFPERQLTGKDFNDLVNHVNSTLRKIETIDKKIENFYSKIIEIVGIFIAIFSIIIAGIQISLKTDGSFIEILTKCTAIFIPIVFCILILLLGIRFILKSKYL